MVNKKAAVIYHSFFKINQNYQNLNISDDWNKVPNWLN